MKTIEDPNRGKKEEDKSLFTEEERLRSQLSNSEWFLRRYGNQLFHLQSVQYNIIRNVDSLSATESLDSLHPFDMDFFIDPDVQEVISTKLAFRIKPYRAYSKSVENSQQLTSSDGGGISTTTASGGGTTATSSTHNYGTKTARTTDMPGVLPHHIHAWRRLYISGAMAGWLLADDNGYPAIEGVWVPPYNHTHNVVIGSHNHTVTIGSHQHSIIISSHNHTIPAHNHDMAFGIYEKTPASPSVNVYLSNNGYDFDVFLGTYTADEEIEFGTKIKGTGWKMVRFEGNQLMRITAYLILKSDIKVG